MQQSAAFVQVDGDAALPCLFLPVNLGQSGRRLRIEFLGTHAIDLIVVGSLGAHRLRHLLDSDYHPARVSLVAQGRGHGVIKSCELLLLLRVAQIGVLADLQPGHGIHVVGIVKTKHALCFLCAEEARAQILHGHQASADGLHARARQFRFLLQRDQFTFEFQVQGQQPLGLTRLVRWQTALQFTADLLRDRFNALLANRAQIVVKQAFEFRVGEGGGWSVLLAALQRPQVAVGHGVLHGADERRVRSLCGVDNWRHLRSLVLPYHQPRRHQGQAEQAQADAGSAQPHARPTGPGSLAGWLVGGTR
ncbi:MAG: hypothetical protein Q7T10_02370 [Rhodoferax sp.]|nr:hypothetical protein [Rhodoferax sp.]